MLCQETHHQTGSQEYPFPFTNLDHFFSFGNCHSQWFFTENMFPPFGTGNGMFQMQICRGGDVHNINIGLELEQIFYELKFPKTPSSRPADKASAKQDSDR